MTGASRAHIAVCTAAAHSHISPLLGVVAELVRRGHRVSHVTTEEFAPLVRSAGATPVVLASSLPTDPADWPREVHRLPLLYLDDARATLPLLARSFADDRPDLVLTEDPAGAGSVLAAKWRIPVTQVWTYTASPTHWSLAEPGTPGANPVAAEFLAGLDAFLTEHGVRGGARAHLTARLAGGLVLTPRLFQPGGAELGPEFTFAGPALAPVDAPQDGPPPEGPPLALVTLGSIDTAHPDFFRTVAEAFAGLDWRVVMAVGSRTDPGALGPLPDGVEAHPWVPQRAVLARASLAVHHGGMATVMECLYHGVPSLVVPRLREQAGNALRLRELGLGAALPLRAVSPDAVRAAVLRLHADAAVRARVASVREEIRGFGGARAAADAVERGLAPS
ncbi:macrolide family glycosyltransferase [Streptomyces sp. NPDC059002]|uniref:macrolide family glycosyltransferase n=1 Tax=Streptomyces sp. NPDC059002 TaxID=3346690 RepID=UPI0036AC8444